MGKPVISVRVIKTACFFRGLLAGNFAVFRTFQRLDIGGSHAASGEAEDLQHNPHIALGLASGMPIAELATGAVALLDKNKEPKL
jgi:hypothetical protein